MSKVMRVVPLVYIHVLVSWKMRSNALIPSHSPLHVTHGVVSVLARTK